MKIPAMNEYDFNALMANLRESIPDFALFEAVYLDNFTFIELSESLGTCVHTVHRRIHRVREALRMHLPPDLPAGSDGAEGNAAAYFD
jgi:DNA-directed RNA polymerase specialized sigma24 family protein